jgi:hypothetical protein
MNLYILNVVFFITYFVFKTFYNARFNPLFNFLLEISYFSRFRKIGKLCWKISEEEIFFNILEMEN